MSRSLLDPLDASERLKDEHDLASRLEAEALAHALRQQQQQAARAPRSTPGECVNCGAACKPLAVYCDADCRDDHETRLAAVARQGAGSAHGR